MYFQNIFPQMGIPFGLKGFAAALLGGLASVPGAIVGGFALGILESLAVGYVGEGARVALADIDMARAREAAADLGLEAVAAQGPREVAPPVEIEAKRRGLLRRLWFRWPVTDRIRSVGTEVR